MAIRLRKLPASLQPQAGARPGKKPAKVPRQTPPWVAILVQRGAPAPRAEYRFHKRRKWRFDFCWPAELLVLEVDGGAWVGGRHTRPGGFIADIDKYNAAVLLGYRLLRCTPDMLASGEAVGLVLQALGLEESRS